MGVEVTTDPVIKAGVLKMLFQVPLTTFSVWAFYTQWDVAADGKRFLFEVAAAQFGQTPFTVVLNWPSLLKK